MPGAVGWFALFAAVLKLLSHPSIFYYSLSRILLVFVEYIFLTVLFLCSWKIILHTWDTLLRTPLGVFGITGLKFSA